jgi:hypothetical protein
MPHSITKPNQKLAWPGVGNSSIPATVSPATADTFAPAATHKQTTINFIKWARALLMRKDEQMLDSESEKKYG